MNMYELFAEALRQPNALDKLRESVVAVRAAGESKEAIMKELERLRKDVSESAEDTILDVMDFLSGWSSSNMRID